MKTFRLGLALAVVALSAPLQAQATSPATIARTSTVVVISSGTGSLPSIGGFRISFAPTGSGFAITPLSGGVTSSSGTYSYLKTSAQAGRITLVDTAGPGSEWTLVFQSASTAAYTLTSNAGAQSGVMVFESPPLPAGGAVANMSVRAQIPVGGQIIPGLVIDGPTRVLLRVAGPALTAFGVTGTLPNPRLTLMAGNVALISNDDWSSSASNFDNVREAATRSGAFAFSFGSRDAAIVADLSAGNYTCLVTGESGTAGEVLLEVYRVPQ